jgi:hypothetical protein
MLLLASAMPAVGGESVAWLWDNAQVPAWSQAHVALLDRHILLSGGAIRSRPAHHQPLDGGIRITPVPHVEVSTVNAPTDMAASRAPIVQAMLQAAARSTSGRAGRDGAAGARTGRAENRARRA